MGYKTSWIGGFLVAGLVSLLALPSAAQETITVTTLEDTADPPFDADDPCGVGTIDDLPGADGEVSLREAIIAANNTQGNKIIVFNPNVIGTGPLEVGFDTQDAGLVLNPLPWLCKGGTTIVGDVDGDGVSDITLDGSALSEGDDGLKIISSGNTIVGLTLMNFPDDGVVLLPLSETTLTSNTLLGNVISGSGHSGVLIQAGFLGVGSPVGHITQTTIQGNSLQLNGNFGVSIGALAPPEGSDASISDITLTGNNIEGNGLSGVLITTQGVSAATGALTITNTTITDNAIVGNGEVGVSVVPLNAQGTVITQVAIAGNTMSANAFGGVAIRGGAEEAAGNIVDAVIEGNAITNSDVGESFIAGISVGGGEEATNNAVTVEIRNNLIQDNIGQSIGVVGGVGDASGNTVAGVIEGNTVVNNVAGEGIVAGIGLAGGITLFGGQRATQNTLTMEVSGNFVQGNTGAGIVVNAGQDGAVDNTVDITLTGNIVTDHDVYGLQLSLIHI